jgi:hypothetical protein
LISSRVDRNHREKKERRIEREREREVEEKKERDTSIAPFVDDGERYPLIADTPQLLHEAARLKIEEHVFENEPWLKLGERLLGAKQEDVQLAQLNRIIGRYARAAAKDISGLLQGWRNAMQVGAQQPAGSAQQPPLQRAQSTSPSSRASSGSE